MANVLAHDFGNVTHSILGETEMLALDLGPDSMPSRDMLGHAISVIRGAGARATALIQGLHDLSREETAARKRVSIADIVNSAQRLARPMMDASVALTVDRCADSPLVMANHLELEQALLNLIVNAGHAVTVMRPTGAMRGGTVHVRCQAVRASERERAFGAKPGTAYAMVEVTDDGVGMDEATIARLFDPFFTTKPPGIGTGLGMTSTYGAVWRHGGFMHVESQPGRGTTISMYLPAHAEDQPSP